MRTCEPAEAGAAGGSDGVLRDRDELVPCGGDARGVALSGGRPALDAERGCLGVALWRSAVRTGADLLWRVQCETVLPLRQALADGSYLSEFAGLPARVVEYAIAGSDEASCRLLTTRLDPLQAPAAELAALYHERWEIESACDEIKTHLLGRHPILSSKTPPLVRQEIEGLMLAHYAVRHFLHEAAQEADEDPDCLSFIHAVRVIRRRIRNPGAFPLRVVRAGCGKPSGTRSLRNAPNRAADGASPVVCNGR